MPKDNKNFFKNKSNWSEIKDRLLGCYLPQYFQKVLLTKRPIYYVDCFAGKGKFEDGNDGSPRIALKLRDECMGRSVFGDGRIDTCFIDLNHAKELSVNIADYQNPNGVPAVVSGRYEEEIETLLSTRKGHNVFLYIDPYGIKALDYGLFDKFSTFGFYSIEMLINMNTFGFFRDACRVMKVDKVQNDEVFRDLDDIVEYKRTEVESDAQPEHLLNSIAGGDYWKNIVRDYNAGLLDGYEAERRFSTEYKQYLNQKYTYVLDMPIRMKPGQRPKYRMIHVTNHEQGCILMADNMANRKDELFIDIQSGGQLSMFEQTVENDIINQGDIQRKLTLFLENIPTGISVNKLLAAFYTEFGVLCKSGDIKSILVNMEKENQIEVMRVPPLTTSGKPSVFFTEGKGKSVTIRRKP